MGRGCACAVHSSAGLGGGGRSSEWLLLLLIGQEAELGDDVGNGEPL